MEIKFRELEGRLLLALEAASRGFRVFFGHKDFIKKGLEIKIIPPGIFFDKSLTRGKEQKISWVREAGCLFVSQDEEGGFRNLSYEHFISYRGTFETLKMSNAVFCWGNEEHEAWTNGYPIIDHKFHLTGSPRIDFWRPDFQGYFKKHINEIRMKHGDFVLVVSNFNQVNSYKSIIERINHHKKIGSIRTSEEVDTFQNKIKDIKRLFSRFVLLVNTLADHFPDVNFVVRPHPVEKISGWVNALAKKDNVLVLFSGGISPWVRASEAILHNGCTTGIEAYVSGTPCIAYTPFSSIINREIPNRLSINCTTEEEVSAVLSRILNGEVVNEHRTPENDDLIRNRLANVDGDTAAKRIVDVLETLDAPVAPPIKPGFAGWKMSVKSGYSRFINKFRNEETRITRKFPGLKLSELKEIQDNMANVTDRYRDCRINRLFGDVFVVEKD